MSFLSSLLWLAVGVICVYRVAWFFVRRWAVKTATCLTDIPYLGQGRPEGRLQGTVVIAGGSFAGLVAARVCSDFYENVIIVEPDNVVEGKRTRIPQALQTHGLLAISMAILRQLFPNFDKEALAADARIFPNNANLMLGETLLRLPGPGPECMPEGLTCSRLCKEELIRKMVLRIRNITFICGTVEGLVASCDQQRIEAVNVRPSDGGCKTIPVDLFLDCTGPTSGAIKWLERCKWSQAKRITYDPQVMYSTVTIPFPDRLRDTLPLFGHPDYPGGYDRLSYVKVLVPGPKDNRMIIFYRIEGDRLMLTMGQWGGGPDTMPSTMDCLIKQTEEIYQAVGEVDEHLIDSLKVLAKALEEDNVDVKFVYHRMGPCYRLNYDECQSLPTNFAALGDAMMRVDPTFGQGISKAMIDVTTLNSVLRETRLVKRENGGLRLSNDFTRDMLAKQLPRILPVWNSSKIIDYGRSSTIPSEGDTLDHGRFQRDYTDALLRVAKTDLNVSMTMARCLQFLEPDLDMLEPSLAVRVIWNMWIH